MKTKTVRGKKAVKAIELLAEEHAKNVVMHNDAFEMRRFTFDDPVGAWPKWAQANYEYARAAFMSFARQHHAVLSSLGIENPTPPEGKGARK